MSDPLTKRARRIVTLARDIARRSGIQTGGDLAVLIAIVEDDGGIAAAILKALQLDLKWLYAQLRTPVSAQPDRSADADIDRVVALATLVASEMSASELGTEHLLLAMIRDTDSAASRALLHANITEEVIQQAASRLA